MLAIILTTLIQLIPSIPKPKYAIGFIEKSKFDVLNVEWLCWNLLDKKVSRRRGTVYIHSGEGYTLTISGHINIIPEA